MADVREVHLEAVLILVVARGERGEELLVVIEQPGDEGCVEGEGAERGEVGGRVGWESGGGGQVDVVGGAEEEDAFAVLNPLALGGREVGKSLPVGEIEAFVRPCCGGTGVAIAGVTGIVIKKSMVRRGKGAWTYGAITILHPGIGRGPTSSRGLGTSKSQVES